MRNVVFVKKASFRIPVDIDTSLGMDQTLIADITYTTQQIIETLL